MPNLIPQVIERATQGSVVGYDIYSRLLKDRIIFVGGYEGEVTTDSANILIAQLLYLDAEDHERDINLYINSPGGMVTAGLAVYDTMQYVGPDITTICLGQASSMAAWLLAAGTPGKRMGLPNSRIMIHQPMGGTQGQATDIEIQAREILSLRTRMNEILAAHTGKSVEEIALDTERDSHLTGQVAQAYWLIDRVVEKRDLDAADGGSKGGGGSPRGGKKK